MTCELYRPDEVGSTTFLVVPVDPVATFGSKRAPLLVTVRGYQFRGRVHMYGGVPHVSMRAEHREAAGVRAGDRVRATFVLDDEPRVPEIPDELAAALRRTKGATAAFRRLSFSHQNEWCKYVRSAVKPETRTRRAATAATGVARGERRT